MLIPHILVTKTQSPRSVAGTQPHTKPLRYCKRLRWKFVDSLAPSSRQPENVRFPIISTSHSIRYKRRKKGVTHSCDAGSPRARHILPHPSVTNLKLDIVLPRPILLDISIRHLPRESTRDGIENAITSSVRPSPRPPRCRHRGFSRIPQQETPCDRSCRVPKPHSLNTPR